MVLPTSYPQFGMTERDRQSGTFIVITQIELRLTRFEGGRKGPVVMFHGVGVSSGIFSLDTIETNLVEFLVEHRYM